MVYRGRPSKSCQQCRKRDIKCDKQKESCGQCRRAKLVCPGYQDPTQTIFHDETKSVVRKATFQNSTKSPSPEKIIAPPLELRAKELFVNHYVYCTTARFPYMDIFYKDRPHPPHLAICVRAVSLAYMAFHLRDPDILQKAREVYGPTLALTNIALQNSDTALHNTTLLTVLLLDLYEKLTQKLVNDYKDDPKHLFGAVALLQLRSPSINGDPIRLQLFRQTTMAVLVRCLKRGDEVPPGLAKLRQSVGVKDLDGQLEELMLDFVALLTSHRKGEILESDMMVKVKEVDDKLLQICLRPPKWKFIDSAAGNIGNVQLMIHLMECTSLASRYSDIASMSAFGRVER